MPIYTFSCEQEGETVSVTVEVGLGYGWPTLMQQFAHFLLLTGFDFNARRIDEAIDAFHEEVLIKKFKADEIDISFDRVKSLTQEVDWITDLDVEDTFLSSRNPERSKDDE